MLPETDTSGGGVWSPYHEHVSTGANLIAAASCKACIHFWTVTDEMVTYELRANKWRGSASWVTRISKQIGRGCWVPS